MTPKVLVNLGLYGILSESYAQTQTGQEILTKYQSYLMANEESCEVANNFVREASTCQYDNGIAEALAKVTSYIAENKTSWAIASACEMINRNDSRSNMLNRNAAAQAIKLLEMEEEDVVKYVRSGALKNVMYCEAFRNIAKSVFKEQPIIEHTADYSKFTPVSIVENVGDGHCFVVAGVLYKQDDAGNISECQWNEVSNTFKTVASLLESNMCKVDEEKIYINYANAEYVIEETGKVTRKGNDHEQTYTVENFRDFARMVVMSSNPRTKNQTAGVMEAIALTAESFDDVMTIDKAGIYTTRNDKFVVIESGANIYASLLQSNRHPKWTVNEDAVKALSFIKTKTNTDLGEVYKNAVDSAITEAEKEHKEEMVKQLNENTMLNLKERIELLTEKFKNDPAKLQILSKLAAEVSGL